MDVVDLTHSQSATPESQAAASIRKAALAILYQRIRVISMFLPSGRLGIPNTRSESDSKMDAFKMILKLLKL